MHAATHPHKEIKNTLGAILLGRFALALRSLKLSQKVKEPSIRKFTSPDTISVMTS